MSPAIALFARYRDHVTAAVAWERRGIDRLLEGLSNLGRTPPSQDGLFDDLADELFARWPVEEPERPASRPCDAIRWAKLHEPLEDALLLAA